MMKRISGNSLVDKARRVEWLKVHKDLWELIDPFAPKARQLELTKLAQKMLDEGLYSAKTYIGDARMGIVKLLQKMKH